MSEFRLQRLGLMMEHLDSCCRPLILGAMRNQAEPPIQEETNPLATDEHG
jgi:hypothetical protein